MKKISSIVFSIILLSFSAKAQQFKRVGVGIYGGPQLFGKIYTSSNLDKITGFTAGIDLRYALSKEPEGFAIHFQPGFNTFRHFKEEGKHTQLYTETTWQWSAVHLPLLLRYTFSSGKVRPFAEIGPTLRLRQSLTLKTNGYGCGIAGCSGRETDQDMQSITSKDAIGLTAGAGLEVDLWKVTIPISVRIQEGFGTYATKVFFYESPGFDNLKTRTIQVTAGMNF